jgi:peptide/nickel transport system substrate-binding protein
MGAVLGGCVALPGSGTGSAGASAEQKPVDGGTVVLGDWESPSSFVPYLNSEAPANFIDSILFAGLTRQDSGLQWHPDLLSRLPSLGNGDVRWDQAARRMSVTYRLRPGLRWSDGVPLTAEDVVFTWGVLHDPGLSAAAQLEGYRAISSVDVKDPLTVRAAFERIYPEYLGLFSAVLPEHRLRSLPNKRILSDKFWSRPDVTSGPFRLEEVVPDDHLVLARNPFWQAGRARGPAHLDRIIYKVFPDLGRLIDAAGRGEVDAVLDIPDQALRGLAVPGPMTLRERPALAYEQVTFNQADPNPLTGRAPPWKDDPTLLSALRLAVDRKGLAAQLLGGRARVADSPIPSAISGFHASAVSAASDPKRAAELLDQDGWQVGDGGIRVRAGRPLEFTLTTALGDPLRLAVEDRLVVSWKALGARVTLANAQTGALFRGYGEGGLLEQGRFEAGLWTWKLRPDPDSLFDLEHSSRIPVAGGSAESSNFGRFNSPAIDRELAEGRTALDGGQRERIYAGFQRAYGAYAAELPLFERTVALASASRLHNLAPNPAPDTAAWNAADWWVEA